MKWLTFILVMVLPLGCSRAPAPVASPANRQLRVFAAASLTQPFTDIGTQFQNKYPGTTVTFNFAGSNELRIQIEQGAPADIFASANQKEMNALSAEKAMNPDSIHIFARNHLAIIVPKDNPAQIKSLSDLARPGVKLIVADPAVPAGSYLLTLLKNAATRPENGADFSDRVLANVKSKEENVKAVVSKIQLGEGDAGVAYVSDLHGAGSDAILGIVIPANLNPLAEYPVGTVSRSNSTDTARDFEAFVLSSDGQSILAKYGFLAPGDK